MIKCSCGYVNKWGMSFVRTESPSLCGWCGNDLPHIEILELDEEIKRLEKTFGIKVWIRYE